MKNHNSLEVKGDVLILKNEFPIRVGFLNDIHGGETRAVCTPTFEYKDAGGLTHIYHANEVQLMLYNLWKRNIELYKKYGVQHIFVVGDAFAGDNYRENGAFVFINKPQQIELVANLLEEVYYGCDKKIDFLIWRGTTYHESKAGEGEMHKRLIEKLQSRGIPAEYMYQVSYVELHGGKSIHTGEKRMRRIFVAHEAPTALCHPATLMSRDIDWCLQSQASGNSFPVDAIIRAHIHNWLHVDHSGIHAIQLPCWIGHVPYKSTVKYFFKLQPVLGGAMMLMDEYGRLQFWGGSYPFGFNKEDKLRIHELCVTSCKLEPEKRIPKTYGVNDKCLSEK